MSGDLRRFLEEDIGTGDISASIIPDIDGRAGIVCEDEATIAGLEEAEDIFSMFGVDCVLFVKDGDNVKAGTRIMALSGPVKGMLTAERTALNMIMRMSGIATSTRKAANILENSGTKITGTRKTTPGFRFFEKKAIRIGGGDPHRFGLYDMVMLKDNHIAACGSVKSAVTLAKKSSFSTKIEVEVSSIEDAIVAAECGADIIMADNVGPEMSGKICEAVKSINERIIVEASGDITLDNLSEYAGKADVVSMGSLTHSVKSIRFSMNIE